MLKCSNIDKGIGVVFIVSLALSCLLLVSCVSLGSRASVLRPLAVEVLGHFKFRVWEKFWAITGNWKIASCALNAHCNALALGAGEPRVGGWALLNWVV